MKKFLLTSLLTVCCMVSWAFEVGNFTYDTYSAATSDDYATVKLEGLSAAGQSATSLYIPASITYNGTTYRVVCIRAEAFKGNTKITSVNVNYGVRIIEASAFANCTKLAKVRLASSVKQIKQNAFAGCTALKEVYYNRPYPPAAPDGWNANSFPSNADMTLYIALGDPNGVYKFKNSTSTPCNKFTYIEKTVDSNDFTFDQGFKVIVTKAPKLTEYGEMMIVGWNGSATTINKPFAYNWITVDGMNCYYTAIADSAFMSNTDLTTVDLSGQTQLKRIGAGAFRKCTALTSVTGIAADTIAKGAFVGCTALATLTMLDGVKRIENAFTTCKALKTIDIPKSTTYVDSYFVDNCSSLKTINVDADNADYASYDGCLYNKSKTTLLRVPENHAATLYYPWTVTRFSLYCMQGLQNVSAVRVPYGVKTLNGWAFYQCSKLTTVYIPSSVTSMGNGMFDGCTNLTNLYVNIMTAPNIIDGTFFKNAPAIIPNLFVPYNKVADYKNAGWTRFTYYNEDGVQARDIEVLMTKTNTNKIYIPITVTSTAPVAFHGMNFNGLARIVAGNATMWVDGEFTVPDYVTIGGNTYLLNRIGEEAFKSTEEFSIKGCAAVDTVSYGAFSNSGLTAIELPNIHLIGYQAFASCAKLAKVTFGPYLNKIDNYGFYNCSSLSQDVILPYGFNHLGMVAFKGTKVGRLLVPSSIETVNYSAFEGMGSLSELIYNKNSASSPLRLSFTDVPTTCKVLVPTGQVLQYRQHNSWQQFGNNIVAGAHDFTYGNGYSTTSRYHMTVTSNVPVTFDGVTYDGTAKYVYHPNIETGTGKFTADLFETDNTYDGGKSYLITEIGDSCLANSPLTVDKNLANVKALERIGNHAFFNSGITGNMRAIESVNYIGTMAFCDCPNLTELFVANRDAVTLGQFFYGNNADDFVCYVPIQWYYDYWGTRLFDMSRYNAFLRLDRVGMQTISLPYAADYEVVDLSAYTVGRYEPSIETAIIEPCLQAPANEGILLDDIVADFEYRIPRAADEPDAVTNLLVGNLGTTPDIYNIQTGYYLNHNDKEFDRPTRSFWLNEGQAYLLLDPAVAGSTKVVHIGTGPTYKRGDIDGNGIVDVTDLTLLIDVVLGKKSVNDPDIKGDCNLDGEGGVDITDITILIDIVLGN